jgi:hypothetical protein
VVIKREWRVAGTNKKTEETEFESEMYFVGIGNSYTQFTQVQRKAYNSQTDSWANVGGTGYGMAKFILTLYEPNTPQAEEAEI